MTTSITQPQQAYDQLRTELRRIATLDSVSSLLSWDEQTQMPPKGAETRAAQASLLARMSHEQFTHPRIGELLQTVEQSDLVKTRDSDAAANARELRRQYDRATKLPASLVEELSRTAVLAQQAWVEARKKSHFPTFQPWLTKTLDLKRQEANCVGFKGHMYNALLDPYEPGATAEDIAAVFEALRPPLVELVGRIATSGRKAPVEILQRSYPTDTQAALGRQAAELVGFDFSAGRLDISVHPFCSGLGPGDTRITTRFDEHNFGDCFFSILHETGHALYEQGLPKGDNWGLPVGEAVSLGIHESQSRMWENLVGRSRAFWQFFLPRLKKTFPHAADLSEDQWVFAINDVRPSLIRVEADEATYNLHVMLRFELEKTMLTGDLTVADIPGAWNDRMKKYLNQTPPDDANGCLQDVHWSLGSIGYFPTYTLGNLYAAQFFEAARRDIPDLDQQFSTGRFGGLLDWLRKNIHRHGKRYIAPDLCKRITGAPLSHEPLMRHLNKKAAEFYGV